MKKGVDKSVWIWYINRALWRTAAHRTLKIKQREEEKPLKINLRSTFKYNSNSCEERE